MKKEKKVQKEKKHPIADKYFKGDVHLAGAVGYFVLAAVLFIFGTITLFPGVGLIGGGCLLLGLTKLVERKSAKSGQPMSKLRAEDVNRADSIKK